MKADLRIVKSIQKINNAVEETKEKQEKIINKQSLLEKEQEVSNNKINSIIQNQEELTKKQDDEKKELENKIEKIKLDKPKDGRDGKNGIDGKDGKDGRDGKDGKNGLNGKDGKDGKDGRNGIDGIDGIGIYNVEINDKGELIVTLTDSRKINCGVVKGKDGIGYSGISVTDAKIENKHLIITLSNGRKIDAGVISGGDIGEEIDPIFTSSPAYNITNNDITNWNNKSNFSGSYDDLEDKPELFSGDYEDLSNKPTIPTKTSELTNDSGFIDTETDPVFSNSVASGITQNDITNWNNKSTFSGSYNDLTDKPTIPTIPANISAFNNDVGYLTTHQDISNKYDKTGGEISGNVKIDGTLTLDIEDEDYDSGITFDKRLDTNLGTILTLNGYANSTEQTNYKPIIRNVGTPNSNYDVANKKYVDDNLIVPNYYLTILNADGTVDTTTSTLNYNTVLSNLTNRSKADYLDLVWGTTRFYAKCIEVTDVNTGDLKFIGEVEYQGLQRYMVFTLNSSNVLTTTNIITFESVSNKVQSVVSNSTSIEKYPSTKAVYDEFQRKPVVIWESSTPSEYLKAVQSNLSASPSWQLTNLDLTPYKRIKIYSCAGQGTGSTASASTTPSIVLEMTLDERARIGAYGNNYVASIVVQKPNDANRLATLTCAVSSDKTSFVVLRQTNLYGTAATSNNDVNANVFLIEGYYY